jgi:GNAT superfamily N-acetyltransferase
MKVECRTMGGPERYDAFALMKHFRLDEAALGEALALFVDRPDYGFIWMAYEEGEPAACISVSFAISTETGGLVAQLHDLWVEASRRRHGLGTALITTLHARLAQLEVTRIDAALPGDGRLRAFFIARGYTDIGGTRFSLRR